MGIGTRAEDESDRLLRKSWKISMPNAEIRPCFFTDVSENLALSNFNAMGLRT
jgi:hypothetical protein